MPELIAFAFARYAGSIDDDVVDGKSWCVLCQHVNVTLGREARGLPRLGHQIQDQRPSGSGGLKCGYQVPGTR